MTSNPDAIRIRPARASELAKLADLVRGRLPDLMKSAASTQADNVRKRLASLLPDEALLLAISERKLTGMAALDLDRARLMAMYLDPNSARADTARRLIEAVEDTARQFGVQRLYCTVKPQAWAFMERMGYQATGLPDEDQPVDLSKKLFDHAGQWEQKVFEIHRDLGIPPNYGAKHRLRMVPDATERTSIGLDIFNRDTELTPGAAQAWIRMRGVALNHGVELKPVSGYRSTTYQAELIRKKLAEGQAIDVILKSSAAPGYSEHHAANALDITAPGVTPLSEDFASSKAYEWLKTHARLYGFRESFPKHNRHSLEWEPWHWCYRKLFDPSASR